MKWVKVITTMRREDWVEIRNNDNPRVAEEHIQTLVDQGMTFEFVKAEIPNAPTLTPPSRQQCQQLGIGVHPL